MRHVLMGSEVIATRDDGEPISAGQVDRRKQERLALENALYAAAPFGGSVLINGILAILLIGWLQAIGVWAIR
jgi:hypothetical protein